MSYVSNYSDRVTSNRFISKTDIEILKSRDNALTTKQAMSAKYEIIEKDCDKEATRAYPNWDYVMRCCIKMGDLAKVFVECNTKEKITEKIARYVKLSNTKQYNGYELNIQVKDAINGLICKLKVFLEEKSK